MIEKVNGYIEALQGSPGILDRRRLRIQREGAGAANSLRSRGGRIADELAELRTAKAASAELAATLEGKLREEETAMNAKLTEHVGALQGEASSNVRNSKPKGWYRLGT